MNESSDQTIHENNHLVVDRDAGLCWSGLNGVEVVRRMMQLEGHLYEWRPEPLFLREDGKQSSVWRWTLWRSINPVADTYYHIMEPVSCGGELMRFDLEWESDAWAELAKHAVPRWSDLCVVNRAGDWYEVLVDAEIIRMGEMWS